MLDVFSVRETAIARGEHPHVSSVPLVIGGPQENQASDASAKKVHGTTRQNNVPPLLVHSLVLPVSQSLFASVWR